MVTEEDIRRVALSFAGERQEALQPPPPVPGARHPAPAHSRTPRCVLRVSCAGLEDRDELLKAEPGTFFITPHYQGYPRS